MTDEKPEKRSTASQLVDMVRDDFILGCSDDGQPYGTYPDAAHVALPLRGGQLSLRAECARRWFDKHNAVASQQALADAITTLEGFARRENPRRLHLRVGEHCSRVYVDMADPLDRVIEIGDGTWNSSIRLLWCSAEAD